MISGHGACITRGTHPTHSLSLLCRLLGDVHDALEDGEGMSLHTPVDDHVNDRLLFNDTHLALPQARLPSSLATQSILLSPRALTLL